jgi:hypothetical protein
MFVLVFLVLVIFGFAGARRPTGGAQKLHDRRGEGLAIDKRQNNANVAHYERCNRQSSLHAITETA